MSEPARTRSRVAVVSTGGTIASIRSSDSGGVAVALSIAELLAGVRDAAAVDVAAVEDLARVNGWNVDPSLMWRVAAVVQQLVGRSDVDGVVVTHGTDTVEETAFLLDVLVDSDKPVVFAAAMRSADATSSDGPHNLVGALCAAGSPTLRGMGAMLCLNDEIHAARWARKTHSSRVDAFTSVGGPVATIDPDGVVRRLHGPPPRWTMPGAVQVSDLRPETVPTLLAYTGMPPETIEAAMASDVGRGLVIEGFGLGNLPGTLVDPIRELIARGVVVVVSTRVPHGGTWSVYGGPGSGTELAEAGALGAGTLTSGKARLLLMTCLAGQNSIDAAKSFQEGVEVLGRGSEGAASWQ